MKARKVLRLCILAFSFAALRVTAQEWAGAGVSVSTGCVRRADSAQAEDYSSWIKPYASGLGQDAKRQKLDVELSLTVLDGDNLEPTPSHTQVCGVNCCQMTTTYSVSSQGIASTTRVTPMAVQGAGPGRLPDDELPIIKKLIQDLLRHPPDDHARLPPPGRRLVLQAEGGNEAVTRVYDRANIPSAVMEVLGLIGATSGPMWMEFKPAVNGVPESGEPISASAAGIRAPHPRDPATSALQAPTVTLATSPDNSMIVTHYLFLGPRTVVTGRGGASPLLVVSDYEQDQRQISVLHAFFTPDSRYLLLLSNLPALYIYDAKTWEPVHSLPGLPIDASAFYPSSDWKHGVAVLRSGEVEAWDVAKGQKQSDLDLQGDLQEVSFSEDDSKFAVSSVHHNQDSSSIFRLRIWDTNTGRFIREMIPPYYFEHDVMSRPMWWGHGKYLLANVRAGHWGGYMIAVWNVDSGQLRGGFAACDSSQDPFEVGIDGSRLLKWCFDETLLVWDVPAAIEKISEFEASLSRAR